MDKATKQAIKRMREMQKVRAGYSKKLVTIEQNLTKIGWEIMVGETSEKDAAMAKALGEAFGLGHWDDLARSAFEPLEKVSIDIGLMEKLDAIAMVPASFDWNDVGGWPALEELLAQDEQGNTVLGAQVTRDCENNIIITQDASRPTLVAGVRDCIIVNGEAGTLVCHRGEIERVKDLMQQVLKL